MGNVTPGQVVSAGIKKGSYALAWEEARKQHCSIVPASILASKFPPQDPAPTSFNAL